jgi:hypothetical protein
MGTSPCSFMASGQQVGAPAAAGVVTDIGLDSISSFGLCQSPQNPQVRAATDAAGEVLMPQPCLPVISGPWTPGSANVTIDGVCALDDASTCECNWGGTITVTSPGQVEVTVQ